jgi:hypothetical protein
MPWFTEPPKKALDLQENHMADLPEIQYLPLRDLALPYYIEKSRSLIAALDRCAMQQDIGIAISIYNIIRYLEAGLGEHLGKPDSARLKQIMVEILRSQPPIKVLESIDHLSRLLHEDFWSFIASYGVLNSLDESTFGSFLESRRPDIRPMLRYPILLKRYACQLKDYFLSDPSNVRFYVEQNLRDRSHEWRGSPLIPNGISSTDFSRLVTEYVNSPCPTYEYLVILSELSNLPPKVRLLAKRKAESAREAALSASTVFRTGVEIKFQDQEEPVNECFDDGILKRTYSLNWIGSNLDNPTLLNNFVYLFEFVDRQARVTLCHLESECGVFEKIACLQRTDRYPETQFYLLKNQAALLSLDAYSRLLSELGRPIEDLLSWFFQDYLAAEFNIQGFHVDIPSNSHSLLNKCKLLPPEIERILKMYQMYVQDGEIDIELLRLSSDQFMVSSCPSLCENKYCYLGSQAAQSAVFYLYSDQCMLSYDHTSGTSHESFARRLLDSSPSFDQFDESQHREIEWLASVGYLEVDHDNIVRIKNMYAVGFLGEIYRNGCLAYHSYPPKQRLILDAMLDDGSLKSESRLFSQLEADFIDFHLNRRKFINSLDLRNKYAHGSHAGSQEDERELRSDYLQLFKILACVVLKINDDLCLSHSIE